MKIIKHMGKQICRMLSNLNTHGQVQIVMYLTAVKAGSISYPTTTEMFIVKKYVFYVMTVFVSVHLHLTLFFPVARMCSAVLTNM
jgi:hypothetical protein